MSSVTLNGARIVSANVSIPHYGAWSADVTMATADPIVDSKKLATTTVSLVIGDLTLQGTIVRQDVHGGARLVQIVAGAAGWRKVIPVKGYSQESGIKLSTIINDAASAVGESIVITGDRSIGTSYSRELAKAERVLALETGGAWWIDEAGVTRLSDRSSKAIVTPFTVTKHLGDKGLFEIATENPSHWLPGRTFAAPQIDGTNTISSVTIDVKDGAVRLIVLSKADATQRLLQSLRKIIRAEMSTLSYAGVWEYTIVSGTTTTVDANSDSPTMPDLTKVPMMAGLIGEVVLPTPGAKCRIRFVNNDPTRPECIGLVGASMNSTVEVSSGLLTINGGSDFLAHAQKVLTELTTQVTWATSHIHPTPWGPSGPPIVPPTAPQSMACSKTKSD